MKDQSTIYADIVKVEKKPDEPDFRYIHARISDETKDLDGQTADYDWLKTALPDWFKWGNVRDMHENNVIGKAKELTDVPAERGFDGVLKVVDPVAVLKLDEGLFTGVSVGIKGPRVINNKGANVHPTQPGRIVGGKIVEVSLVDHPCNENCKLTVAKDVAASGLELITKGAKLEKIVQVDLIKDGGLYWYKRAKWNAAARREAEANGHAEAGGRFPIDDASDVSDAVHLINTGHGDEGDKAHVKAQAARLGVKNPFKRKNQDKIAGVTISSADLDAYKSRWHPALANAGVALADGSYLIMDEGDILLAKAMLSTGYGNTVAADLLIKRREGELVKAKGQTQQPTPDQAQHPNVPGARENRDNPEKNAPPEAKPKASKNPDKESPAHQEPDASGSSAAFDDQDASEHPPTTPKKKKGMGGKKQELPANTHGDDTGSVGTQTNSAKFAEGNPAEWSDKKLSKAIAFFQTADADAYKAASNSYPGDGRPLLEQIARSMQGRIYNAVDHAQGATTVDTKVDKPEEAGENSGKELLNSSGLMRDGDSRIGAHTPAQALAQGGPMSGGNAQVSSGGDSGVPNTSHPFNTAPQAGSDPARMAPGSLPGTLSAPGDANPVLHTSGPAGGGGESAASPPRRSVSGVAQAGPDPNTGTRTAGSPNTAFANPTRVPAAGGKGKAAKADKKKAKKYAKTIDKLAKAAVADRIETAIPDSVKAAVAGILKKFEKNLEKTILVKYATADQLKNLQADIDKLGEMARPGGPFVGQIVAVDKVVNANEFAQPENQVIEPDILDQMERYERMSKSDNRQLATSAQQGLKKLLETHFPAQVSAELTKRRRSAAK